METYFDILPVELHIKILFNCNIKTIDNFNTLYPRTGENISSKYIELIKLLDPNILKLIDNPLDHDYIKNLFNFARNVMEKRKLINFNIFCNYIGSGLDIFKRSFNILYIKFENEKITLDQIYTSILFMNFNNKCIFFTLNVNQNKCEKEIYFGNYCKYCMSNFDRISSLLGI